MATIQWLNGSHVELQNQKIGNIAQKPLFIRAFTIFFFGK